MNVGRLRESIPAFHHAKWVCLTILLTAQCIAETPAAQQIVHASKAALEQALQQLRAESGGKLPTLHGFVDPGKQPLSRYQEARYDYDLQVTAISPTESSVEVRAEITAWYQDDDPSRSGYQELPSNGRLEADLLERLGNALRTEIQMDGGTDTKSSSLAAPALPAAPGLPDSPSASKAALLLGERPSQSTSRDSERGPRPESIAPTTDARLQQLHKEEKSLEEVLHNQVTPKDLALVKNSGTRVLLRPADDGPVVLVAEADDELKVLERTEEWVHVQLSGPARGWIRTTELDLSGVSVPSVTPGKGLPPSREQVLQTTREETATFPGNWEPLRGKQVQILWVEPDESAKDATPEKSMAALQSLLRAHYAHSPGALSKVAGVVVVMDSADGGMMATTVPALRRWKAGNLSSASFWRQCWFDPPSAFSYLR